MNKHIKILTEPLDELLRTTSNLYYPPEEDLTVAEAWDKVTEFFLNDKNENQKVQDLLACLRKDGKFRDPVMLSYPDKYDLEEYPGYGTTKYVVGNGTHRTVAHILHSRELNNPKMPIQFYIWQENQPWKEEDEFDFYETKIELPAHLFAENKIYDLMEILHLSKPTSNGEWLEVEFVSARDKEHVTLFWGDPKSNRFGTEEAHRLILETLKFNNVTENADEIKITSTEEKL